MASEREENKKTQLLRIVGQDNNNSFILSDFCLLTRCCQILFVLVFRILKYFYYLFVFFQIIIIYLLFLFFQNFE